MKRLVALVGVPLLVVVGCSSDNSQDKSMSEGKVTDRNQTQNVSPDQRTATQTRSQIRETPEGVKVRETQTQKREVLDNGGNQSVDPSSATPAK